MKQFNYKTNTFDDLIADETGNLKTHGKDWVRLTSQDDINAVSLAITTGGEVWLDEAGELKTSPPRPSPAHKWDSQSKTWLLDTAAAAELKAQQQEEMWARIKAKRYDNLRHGVYIKSVGKWFQTDDATRLQYLTLRTLPNEAFPLKEPWRTMDNTDLPPEKCTKALFEEIVMQMVADEMADFHNAKRHRAAMLQADNPFDYDYSGGWTANFDEQPAAELEKAEK
nr:DUF4376 domain-containing protein [uncultured Kingella sp.]